MPKPPTHVLLLAGRMPALEASAAIAAIMWMDKDALLLAVAVRRAAHAMGTNLAAARTRAPKQMV